jgi:hypothetical protein
MSAFPYKKTSLALIISASACPVLADTGIVDTEISGYPFANGARWKRAYSNPYSAYA